MAKTFSKIIVRAKCFRLNIFVTIQIGQNTFGQITTSHPTRYGFVDDKILLLDDGCKCVLLRKTPEKRILLHPPFHPGKNNSTLTVFSSFFVQFSSTCHCPQVKCHAKLLKKCNCHKIPPLFISSVFLFHVYYVF